ncbi:Vacuolar protein sorting-associated protein 41-like protein [Hibiscus syriacus]|uniref:Vacuolar protein sorting-associated protein 41 homolog n=1 Tax=Hibiscus syriacus TaxID=106335 RepID=A0A6A2ZJH2_HIBSY|nr:Vacuolar protein sorting-associated protein 41-like protein [Hibiscus syriacus]
MQKSPFLSENGVEGDDEREEEEEEDDEEEPRLKYQRMGGSIPSLLSGDSASCIAVAERMIALGTDDGTVHILDFLGNQVKEFSAHSAAVNDLSFDIEGEYIGSCSDDGFVVLHSLFTDEKLKFEYHRPMKAIALDPDYARKSSGRFVTGGLAGHLYLNTKKWLGYAYKDQVLHSGEGPIHAVKWRTSLIAWANDMGVKVYDAANDQRITFIERPRGSPHPEILLPHLVWQDDALLVIGWGTYVKIASIRSNLNKGANGTYKHVSMSNMNQVNIVASFQTSYYILGIAPFGDSLVVLAYILGEKDGEKEFSSTIPSRQVCVLYSSEKAKFLVMVYTPYFEALCAIISALSVSVPASLPIYLHGVTLFLTEATAVVTGNAQRPEVHIVSWNNDELATDVLPQLCRWTVGYIVSPKDVVIAKPRDAEDHIAWLLQHGCHEKALAAVEAGQGRSKLLDEVGTRYLDHLIVERKYAEAASLCPKLLRGSPTAWERWVFHFSHLRQLPVLVPYMPTETPRLRDTAYEVALVALATNPAFHKDLVSTVKSWPRVIYSVLPVISAIEPQLNTSSMTDALKEALAELYVINGQYEKAFSLYADLMKPDIFDFIERHNLQNSIHEKVVPLMIVDCKQAVNLLLQNRDLITPSEVVSQLLNTRKKCDTRYFLHLYLHSLFEVNPHAGKEFHDMQVELYVEYDPKMLLPFLRGSQHYTLEKAYEICARKDLLREQVFILGRMGNSKQALAVIINELGDIEEAVEFVTMQHDDDLWEELIHQCLH